jgi:predicted transcriptional regulator
MLHKEERDVLSYIEYLAQYGVSVTTTDKIAKNLKMSKGHAEQIVKNLVQRGYIEKKPNELESKNGKKYTSGCNYKIVKIDR